MRFLMRMRIGWIAMAKRSDARMQPWRTPRRDHKVMVGERMRGEGRE